MSKPHPEDALRQRALQAVPALSGNDNPAELARVLHELDVYRAELEIQNEDLRQTQRELETTRDRYRRLFDQATVPLLSLASNGLVVEVNQAAANLLQRERHQALGRTLLQFIAEGDQPRWARQVAYAFAGSPTQPFEVTLVSRPADPRLVIAQFSLLKGGDVPQLICQLHDVTAERQSQREAVLMQQRLLEAEKLQAVGSVAAAISHDVNNVLMSIVSLAEFSRASVSSDTELARDLEALLDSAWQATRLLRGLLGFSRSSRRPQRIIDVLAVLQRVVAALAHKKPGVRLVLAPAEGSLNVLGDADDLYQALFNVAVNGIDAMTEGTLTLSGERAESASEHVARIRIRDEGCGMDEATKSRVFDPLFTTKAAQGGTGLGMTIVRRVIGAHRGRLEFESAPGKGTVVTIELPLDESEVTTTTSAPAAEPTLAGLRLLLVDDDPAVRNATKRQLEASGAIVHAEEDGKSALRAVADGLRVDAGVIDVNMPVWSGPELVSRLHDLLGKLPVVFVTGGAGELVPEAWLREPHLRLLKKPWMRRELVEAIVDVAKSRAAEAPHGYAKNSPIAQ